MSLYYLYGVTENPVHSVDHIISEPHENLYAIVEEVDEEFSEDHFQTNLQNQEWLISKAEKHQRTLGEVATETSVIPIAFGSIFKERDAIKNRIESDLHLFTRLMDLIRGKHEWGIKMYYKKSQLVEYLVDNQKELKELQEEITQAKQGKAFILKKELEKRTKEEVKESINSKRKALYEGLSKMYTDSKLLENSKPELDNNKDSNILNIAILIGEEDKGALEGMAQDFNDRNKSTGFYLTLTGPWPPYNFVKV